MAREYWSGTLVQIAPDTYEVRHVSQTSNKEKPKVRSQVGKAKQKREEVRGADALEKKDKWYLLSDSNIVNGEGEVISSEVVITKRSIINGRKKIFLRFTYENSIWIGYTIINEPNRIKAWKSKSSELIPTKTLKGRRVCSCCNKRLVRGKNEVCSVCIREAKKVPCKTPGCLRKVDPTKVQTGYCKICVRKVHTYHQFCVPPKKRKPDATR